MKKINIKCKLNVILIMIFTLFSLENVFAQITLARLHYEGGGDWYNDPEVLPNLAEYINNELQIHIDEEQAIVKPDDANLSNYPFIYVTGHGNIRMNEREISSLRDYLASGGFLLVDDDYGLDKSFRKLAKDLFPTKNLVELPKSHPIFHSYYTFDNGLPKTHKHDDKRPQALALFADDGRLMLLYFYESNITDGWADARTHKDPADVKKEALQFGLNLIYYLMVK